MIAARMEAPRAGVRPVTVTAPARPAGLAWPRLPAAAELATIGAGYLGYALVRLATHADRHAASAEAARYYYGLLHFLVTPLVLARLYQRRPAAFGRLRSALVLATTGRRVMRGLSISHLPIAW